MNRPKPTPSNLVVLRRNSLQELTHTWVLDNPDLQEFLITVANGRDPLSKVQIIEDVYLMLDENHDKTLDRNCSPPGWSTSMSWTLAILAGAG